MMAPKINLGKTKELVEKAQQKTQEFAGQVVQFADEKGQILKEQAEENAQIAKEKYKELAEQVGQVVDENSKQIKKYAEQTNEKVQKVINETKDTVKEIVDEQQLKLYNPVFISTINNEEFRYPQLIHIVESNKRQKIDAFKDSIGWIDNKKGLDVLHIYHSNLNQIPLNFHPMVKCGNLYFIDEKNTYIDTFDYFNEIEKSKCAELQNIAFCLGAKSFSVEVAIDENKLQSLKVGHNGKIKYKDKNDKAHTPEEKEEGIARKTVNRRFEVTAKMNLEGSDKPIIPELRWFKNDNQIKSLINMRCSKDGFNKIKSQRVKTSYNTSKDISADIALKIDAVIKDIGINTKNSFNYSVESNSHKQLIYNIEF